MTEEIRKRLVQVWLEGNSLEAFVFLKEKLGLKKDSEVLRHLIIQYERLLK